MKAASRARTPQTYLRSLPADRRADMEALHRMIRRAAPRLKPAMWGSVIGYGSYRYRYPSGREGTWFILGLSCRKRAISLYACAADERGYLAERFASSLGRVKTGRACISFRRLADLDQAAATRLIKACARLGGASAM